MAGAMRKMGEYLGLVVQADDEDYVEEPTPARTPAPRQQPAPVAHIEERRKPAPVATAAAPAVESLARIETVTPRSYNDARTLGEHYRSGVPVIMNLSEIDEDDAKRLVDFAAGLVFAVRGTINRVTPKVFLLSPENVVVSDEDRQRIVEGGFFNQS